MATGLAHHLIDLLQTAAREVLVPFDQLIACAPLSGQVRELGCGQGLLIERIAGQVERVIGVDFDPRKCQLARDRLARFGNVAIVEDDIIHHLDHCSDRADDLIILADTLSHMPRPMQDQVLQKAIDRLAPAGALLLKIMDAEPRHKALLARLISTPVCRLGFTRSHRQRFSYRSHRDYSAALRARGLDVVEHLLHRERYHPLPHVVIVGRRRQA